MHKDKIIIIGGKGTAVVVAEQIDDAINRFNANLEILGFAFDDPTFGNEINDYPILSNTYNVYEKYKQYKDVYFIFQMYRSDLIKDRILLRDSYNIPLNRYYNFIHPSVVVLRSVKMGYGNTILSNTVLDSNVILGSFNTLYSNTLICHDSKIGNSNFFAGHSCLGSGINIGNGCFFGLNCCVKNFVKIDNFNYIGMGGNVIQSFDGNNVLVGNPARKIRDNYVNI